MLRILVRLLVFVVVAVAVYLGLAVAPLLVVFAEGGGVSCVEDSSCTPAQEWLDERSAVLSPVAGVVAGAAGALVARALPLRHRRRP